MGIVYNRPKPLSSSRAYVATEKFPETYAGRDEIAYRSLADNVRGVFGETPATPIEIHNAIMSPLGLSTQDTSDLIQRAKAKGYLRLA